MLLHSFGPFQRIQGIAQLTTNQVPAAFPRGSSGRTHRWLAGMLGGRLGSLPGRVCGDGGRRPEGRNGAAAEEANPAAAGGQRQRLNGWLRRPVGAPGTILAPTPGSRNSHNVLAALGPPWSAPLLGSAEPRKWMSPSRDQAERGPRPLTAMPGVPEKQRKSPPTESKGKCSSSELGWSP